MAQSGGNTARVCPLNDPVLVALKGIEKVWVPVFVAVHEYGACEAVTRLIPDQPPVPPPIYTSAVVHGTVSVIVTTAGLVFDTPVTVNVGMVAFR